MSKRRKWREKYGCWLLALAGCKREKKEEGLELENEEREGVAK